MFNINRLQSQRAQIREITKRGDVVVYGYLRSKRSGHASAGSPYYIGIASNATRPFGYHRRYGDKRRPLHDVPVPSDERLIRIFSIKPSRDAAGTTEKRLIDHYGRRFIDGNGILLNKMPGGGGIASRSYNAAQRKQRSIHFRALRFNDLIRSAKRYGICPLVWAAMTALERQNIHARSHRGIPNADLFLSETELIAKKRGTTSARRYGITTELWMSWTTKQKNRAKRCHRTFGVTGDDLLREMADNNTSKSVDAAGETRRRNTAKKYRIPFDVWSAMSARDRGLVSQRFRDGVCGDALYMDLIGDARDDAKRAVAGPRASADKRLAAMAAQIGVSLAFWKSLNLVERNRLSRRHKRGQRGDDLFAGFDLAMA